MRALLTSGIKAILAIAALSTAAHWALRLQREPGTSVRPVLASVAEPETTGSVAPRRMDAAPASTVQQAAAMPSEPVRAAPSLDQSGLSALIAGAAATAKPKPAATAAKPVAKIAIPAKVAGPAKVAVAAKVAVSAKPADAAKASPAKGPATAKVAAAKPTPPKPVPTKVAALEKADAGAKVAKH
ncbi:hypothetical protein [Methylobacterium aerolatum]|uniref:Uncharacterized protein n=1 Tax=Methylobacterium aerolatum TaxID=418708 RepID=A0ABU0I043_9HYPH|nr:hypothetical protein [Methylobacterium aerolatum]MDQ0447951.1 hypothetical protein [Methylobacterium aerolatum]GJD34343.1 hypothetical protein FMGBMHLM_1241 [Methylobacterium aerolatum]